MQDQSREVVVSTGLSGGLRWWAVKRGAAVVLAGLVSCCCVVVPAA